MAHLFVSIADFHKDTLEEVKPGEPTFIENKLTGAMVRAGQFHRYLDPPANKAVQLMFDEHNEQPKPATEVYVKFADCAIKVR